MTPTATAPDAQYLLSLCRSGNRGESARLLDQLTEQDPASLLSTMETLDRLPAQELLVPVLFRLTHYPRLGIRCRAAYLLARHVRNPETIRDLLTRRDSRLRTSVVEGMREWNQDPELLDLALRDTHHRVVTTAIVSLYAMDKQRAAAYLRECLNRPDPQFRAAGAWAIGAIGTPELREAAEMLRRDVHPSVRWNALRALASIHRAARG